MDSLIQELNSMPCLLTGKDLIRLRLSKTDNSLYLAKRTGQAPDHIKFAHKEVLYPRDAVIKFIQESRLILGSTGKTTTVKPGK